MKRITGSQLPLIPLQPSPVSASYGLNPYDAELGYLARHLLTCTLPHSDPGTVDAWTRQMGGKYGLSLTITRSTFDSANNCLIGYPYGSIPRLILCWICTEVTRKRERRLELGNTLSDFLRGIGLDPRNGTGPRGDSTRVKHQMHRLFGASISITIPADNIQRFANMHIVDSGELWWTPARPDQGTLWGSWVHLSESFYNSLRYSPVPIDLRVLREIKSSPLALDLYGWLTYAQYKANRFGDQAYTYAELMDQLGAGYATQKEFSRYVRLALSRITAVYTGARLVIVPGGLVIRKGGQESVIP